MSRLAKTLRLLTGGRKEAYCKLFEQNPMDILLVEELNKNGVSKAVILSSVWRVPNALLAGLVKKYPNRLIGFGKWLPGAKGDVAADQVEEAIRKYGLKGEGEELLSEFHV